MPPSGYLSATGIQSCLQYIASTYPSISNLIVLPETSVLGETIRAIRIGKGGGAHRHSMVIIGGVHARELVPPDALVSLALRLCQAYTAHTGLAFGGRTVSAGAVKLIVEGIDLVFLPLVNPDGRSYVLAPTGDAGWRKNRRQNGGGCYGVDINRNYDFLWSSGIGTSSNPCEYQIFRGTAPFSEPETRNVRWLLDNVPSVRAFVDVHSYSELILYPWGDDTSQTNNPPMNFHNAAYDGLRGNPYDSVYLEYIRTPDRDWFANAAAGVRNAIAQVRGRTYLAEPSVGLYPTSGTSDDYAYARHIVDPSLDRVYALTFEIGSGAAGGFQPQFPEASQQMDEAAAGLLQYAIYALCFVEETVRFVKADFTIAKFAKWPNLLEEHGVGRRYLEMLPRLSAAFIPALAEDEALRGEAVSMLTELGEALDRDENDPKIDGRLVARGLKLLDRLAAIGGPDVAREVEELRVDATHFRDRTIREGLELVAVARERPGSGRPERGASVTPSKVRQRPKPPAR